MSGVIPTELGYLVKVKSLDLRKFRIMILFLISCLNILSYNNNLMDLFNTGDYKSPPRTAAKNRGVAIPSELGQLKLWKHVIFGKSRHDRLGKV